VRGLIAAVALAAAAGPALAACDPATAEFRTPAGRTARFTVELADDAAERARGLMFRESMASGAGMLFLYDRPQPVSFWMKNTLIPLDMVFMDASGTVTRVHEAAVPGDLRPIDGGEGVIAVLEINARLARGLGIGPGAVMRHPGLPQAGAAWPCP
jgi:hypothetical protein